MQYIFIFIFILGAEFSCNVTEKGAFGITVPQLPQETNLEFCSLSKTKLGWTSQNLSWVKPSKLLGATELDEMDNPDTD